MLTATPVRMGDVMEPAHAFPTWLPTERHARMVRFAMEQSSASQAHALLEPSHAPTRTIAMKRRTAAHCAFVTTNATTTTRARWIGA